ncbi:MAG: response regulator, partial [Bacteroidota bacterium]
MYSTPHPTFGTRSRSQTLFHSETGSSGFSKPRLLIVEDDPALLRMMEVWLSRHFDVVTASNGRQALHETVRSSPDLVIADIDMPFMDGIELQQALSADPQLRHVPFLFVTGNIIRLGTERRY